MSNPVKINSAAVKKSIPTEVGVEAAEQVTGIANDNGIAIALAGGIAMHFGAVCFPVICGKY